MNSVETWATVLIALAAVVLTANAMLLAGVWKAVLHFATKEELAILRREIEQTAKKDTVEFLSGEIIRLRNRLERFSFVPGAD